MTFAVDWALKINSLFILSYNTEVQTMLGDEVACAAGFPHLHIAITLRLWVRCLGNAPIRLTLLLTFLSVFLSYNPEVQAMLGEKVACAAGSPHLHSAIALTLFG